jgi:protein arginine N-methyltransferase 7
MFLQKINPITGEYEWACAEDPGGGGVDDSTAGLVSSSSYLDMLMDERRNLAYKVALERVVRPGKIHSLMYKPDFDVD